MIQNRIYQAYRILNTLYEILFSFESSAGIKCIALQCVLIVEF